MWLKLVTIVLSCFGPLVLAQHEAKEWSLYFENNAHTLTQDHLRKIDSIKNYSLRPTDTIVIKGFASSPAAEAYNLALSNKRATGVKQQFSEYSIIISQGFGEVAGDEAENRRVDVYISYKNDPTLKGATVIAPTTKTINDISKVSQGEKVALKGIHFYPGRDDIRTDSYAALEELLRYLKENETVVFRLLGHVCCGKRETPGLDGYNNRTGKNNLSEARAKRIYNFLLKNGIDKKRMSSRGYAYRYPTGKGRAFDRRVEIEIISR